MKTIDRLRKETQIEYKSMTYSKLRASLIKEGFTKEEFEGCQYVTYEGLKLYSVALIKPDYSENVRIYYCLDEQGEAGKVTDAFYHDNRIKETEKMEDDTEVEGWKNYETWSVMLDLDNVEKLYFKSKEWAEEVRQRKRQAGYYDLLHYIGCYYSGCKTQNGTTFMSDKVDKKAIVEAVMDENR